MNNQPIRTTVRLLLALLVGVHVNVSLNSSFSQAIKYEDRIGSNKDFDACEDFRFKRMNYVDDVRDRVYDRMISERNRIADQFRSEGQGKARVIEGNKERDLAEIQSEAFRQAEEIKGKADAEATAIYAAAYNRSRTSVELYKFLRTMESFEKSMDEKTSIILSTDSEFFSFRTVQSFMAFRFSPRDCF